MNGLIKSRKRKYYGDEFVKIKGDKKKTWCLINELRGKNKSTSKASFLIDNERILSRRLIADKFNNYFISLASNLNRGMLDELNFTEITPFESYLSDSIKSSIYFEDSTPQEIIEIVEEFSNNKASDIPIMVVKRTIGIIAPALSNIYNMCMTNGIFPDPLKLGKVTPIFKKGKRELLENYRPISTLPIFGKIFEILI